VIYDLRNLGFHYEDAEVLRGITLSVATPELVALVGPNGAGKSTLLNVMAGLRDSYTGECLLEGVEIRRCPRRMLARSVSFVPQSLRLDFPFSAEQVVMMGRTPYADGLFESEEDVAAVEHAMEVTDTLAFRHRDFRTLSGGERQRVVLASALAQSPRVLLLDEPTTFLDLRHQISLYRLLADLCDTGIAVIAATHDLNLAATYCDRVIVLQDGAVSTDAAPAAALTPEHLASVFRVNAEVGARPDGRPWVFYGR
jgi:ABC-type cobalamin/Fe3+-siderophores transport system ATPase subunit